MFQKVLAILFLIIVMSQAIFRLIQIDVDFKIIIDLFFLLKNHLPNENLNLLFDWNNYKH